MSMRRSGKPGRRFLLERLAFRYTGMNGVFDLISPYATHDTYEMWF